MKRFREYEGYDYWKFCKLASEDRLEMEPRKSPLEIKMLEKRILTNRALSSPLPAKLRPQRGRTSSLNNLTLALA